MSEETTNTPDFANQPQLEKHPLHLNPDAANKDSDLNQKISHAAEWLKANKDKAGTDEYMQNLQALQSLADKGYPMAQFKYAHFLSDAGAIQSATLWYDMAAQNENSSSDLRKEINSSAPNGTKQNPAEEVKEIKRYLNEHANESDSSQYKKMEQNLQDMANQGIPEAVEAQAQIAEQSKGEEANKKQNPDLASVLEPNSHPPRNLRKGLRNIKNLLKNQGAAKRP